MSLTKTEVKDIQSLLTKKGRKQNNRYLAEGIRLLEEAVRHGIRPEVVFFSDSVLSERGHFLVNTFAARKVPTVPLPARQLESLNDTEESQGILAVLPYPSTALAELRLPRLRRVLLCERIGDPGNLGTLLRSALAFDFDLAILTGMSAEPYSPKVVRASAGAVFGLPIAVSDTEEVLNYTNRRRLALVAADITGDATGAEIRKLAKHHSPIMLAIGSEGEGLSQRMLSAASVRIRIAHSETVESLNAAVAGSILMKEMYHVFR